MPGDLPADPQSLAVSLCPLLREQSDGRLSPVEWFRAAWQRGGAATGFATWTQDNQPPIPVVLKLPVGPVEYRWTSLLGATSHDQWNSAQARATPTPRVIAQGTALGGFDLAWLIMERLPGRPLTQHLEPQCIHDLLIAACDFHTSAVAIAPPDEHSISPDWEATIGKAREIVRAGGIPEAQKWNEAIHRVQKALPTLRSRWEARPHNVWCHGDLHPGNALRRDDPPPGSPTERHGCVLIDLALVHAGHWIEDALYLERQFWGYPEMLDGIKPVSVLARLRRERGLPVDDDYPRLSLIRRVLAASCAPALVEREGNPRYLHAALHNIEQFLPQAMSS
ncbi:MAG: aminoglycoside phosphotransferase family protein [Phycisphaerales bacterium]|nr:aminoglycoside phosphotransferase family protein [Phycisphaerales bacterium]